MTSRQAGQGLERHEDGRFLRGRGCFVGDFELPDMCHAVVVRSPVANGRLLSLDISAANAVPGVVRVLTHADIAEFPAAIPIRVGGLDGLSNYLQSPLASERVRYVGEPLALVVASDPYIAEDAADLVYADIDLEDAVTSIGVALRNDTLVHASTTTNLAASYVVQRGNVASAFARAEYTRKEAFRCHRHSSVPLETRGLVAQWNADEQRLQVWGACKVPFFNRTVLAGMLGLDLGQVDLIELDVGGSFGSRGEFYPEDFLIPMAARLTGCAIRWIEDRRENLLAMNHSREMECELEIAATHEGTILGLRGALVADMGAYARTTGGIVPAKAGMFLPGPYAIENYCCDVRAVMTNKTPCGTYRGPGRYEANFFRERLIDMMAADLGLDPALVRLRNLVPSDQMPYDTGRLVPYERPVQYDSGNYAAVCRDALARFDYDAVSALRGKRINGKWHGVGIACFVDSSGGGPAEHARVEIASAERVRLFTGGSSSGQGLETTYAQILADELAVDVGAIEVIHGSTTGVAIGVGTFHGRGIVMGGSAVKRAGEALVAKLVAEASRRSKLEPSELLYVGGKVLRRDDGATALSIAQLCEDRDRGDSEARALLVAEGSFEQAGPTFEYGTQIAHVAIDAETWAIEVVRFVTVEDCGNLINPLIVHGQVIGATVQGLGGTLLEEFVYDESGQMLCGTFADYLLPTSTDFAYVEGYSVNLAPSPLNPLGAKGVGEGATGGVGGAIANAVSDALRSLGVNVVSLPLSPSHISALVRAARTDVEM